MDRVRLWQAWLCPGDHPDKPGTDIRDWLTRMNCCNPARAGPHCERSHYFLNSLVVSGRGLSSRVWCIGYHRSHDEYPSDFF